MVTRELVLESSKLSRNLDPEKNTTVGSTRNFRGCSEAKRLFLKIYEAPIVKYMLAAQICK